jgi:hypothetical protein
MPTLNSLPVAQLETQPASGSGTQPASTSVSTVLQADAAIIRRKRPLRIVAPSLALFVASLAGCNDIEPKLSSIQEKVFDLNCTTASCHGSPDVESKLDLTKGKSHAALVGVPARAVGAVEDGLLLVKPGDPAASFLHVKLHRPMPIAYGIEMPYGGNQLDDDALEAIDEWIQLGAKDD